MGVEEKEERGEEVGHVHIWRRLDGTLDFDFHWTGTMTEEELAGILFERFEQTRKKGMDS